MRTRILVLLTIALYGCAPATQTDAPVAPIANNSSGSITPPSSRRADLVTVTPAFGDLVVHAGTSQLEARKIPWSSWWYPMDDNTLYDGSGSTLAKYDAYVEETRGRVNTAAAYEAEQAKLNRYSPWEGLCDAWAAASLLEPEPNSAITVRGIPFDIADQKALLLKTYEQIDGLKIFGQRFNGRRGDDFDDIYPDQFHKILQVELGVKRRGFIMDRDPGVEVWNQPVYAAYIDVQLDKQNSHLMHVDTWVTWADDVSASFDTIGTIAVDHEYTYDLYGYPQANGGFKVVYGVWTGASLDDHPDYVTLLPEGKVTHKSSDPNIDDSIVQEILTHHRSRDELTINSMPMVSL